MNKGRDIVMERVRYSLLSTIIGLSLTAVVGRTIQPYLPERHDNISKEFIQKFIQDNYTPEQIKQMRDLYEQRE